MRFHENNRRLTIVPSLYFKGDRGNKLYSNTTRLYPIPLKEMLQESDISLISTTLHLPRSIIYPNFISIPKWVDTISLVEPIPPCLQIPSLNKSIWLLSYGWEKPIPTQLECQKPTGGQLALGEGKIPELSIIITVQHDSLFTIECFLAALSAASEIPSAEFIILSLGEIKEEEKLIGFIQRMIWFFDIQVKRSNIKWLTGRSLLLEKAAELVQGKYLLFIDDDTILQQTSLKFMYETFLTHTNVGIVSPKFVQPNGSLIKAGEILFSDGSVLSFGNDQQSNYPLLNFVRETEYASYSCMMISRAAFSKVHYDPSFEFTYQGYSDADTSYQVRSAGLRVIYQPFATVVQVRTQPENHPILENKEESKGKFIYRWEIPLSCHFPVDVVKESPLDLLTPMTRLSTLRLLIVDWMVPEIDNDPDSIRIFYLLQILKSFRAHITFIPLNMEQEPHYLDRLRYIGVEILYLHEVLYQKFSFDGICRYDVTIISKRKSFDLVYETIRANCPNAPIIFDMADLQFFKEIQERKYVQQYVTQSELLESIFGEAWHGSTDPGAINTETTLELKYVQASSAMVVQSRIELIEIKKYVPEANIRVIPSIHLIEPTVTPFSQRNGIAFIANFRYGSNIDGVFYFVNEILPLIMKNKVIQSESKFIFHIVSSTKVPEPMKEIEQKVFYGTKRVKLHEEVSDIKSFFSSIKLNVIPLRWGIGFDNKIINSFKFGVPVICTSLVQQEMLLFDGIDALISDDANDFAQEVIQAYTSEDLWAKLVHGGYQNIQKTFSISKTVDGIVKVIKDVLSLNQNAQKLFDNGKRTFEMSKRCTSFDDLH